MSYNYYLYLDEEIKSENSYKQIRCQDLKHKPLKRSASSHVVILPAWAREKETFSRALVCQIHSQAAMGLYMCVEESASKEEMRKDAGQLSVCRRRKIN